MESSSSTPGQRILIVDDDEENLTFLRYLLESAGYTDIVSTTDPLQAMGAIVSEQPDLALVDLHMPGLNGYALIGAVRAEAGDTSIPLIVLTADHSREAKERALKAGASDFLTKPFDHVEIVLRVKNWLELRRLHRQLESRNRSLDEQVKERTEDLEEARLETLDRLAVAAEYRDDATGQHARRVGEISGWIAEAHGIPPDDVEVIQRAAPLHDLGKIGIPDWILLKPGPLSEDELLTMKQHTVIGSRILGNSRSKVLQRAEEIALTHHEHWDGDGYEGMCGEDIPLSGRVVAIADAFDAMTSERPYRPAREPDVAINEIASNAGKQFDPALVAAFLRVVNARTSHPTPLWIVA